MTIRNEALEIQLKVFDEHREEDIMEFSHRLEDIRSELEYPSQNRNVPLGSDSVSLLVIAFNMCCTNS